MLPEWTKGYWFAARKKWIGRGIVPVTRQGYLVLILALACASFGAVSKELFSDMVAEAVAGVSVVVFLLLTFLMLFKTEFND